MASQMLFALICVSLGSAIQISTELGDIEGVSTADSVHQFLNIPYAEPPVGELRWKPPVSLATTPWDGKLDATKWGNGCAQPTMMHFFSNDLGAEFIEDCLYLNVFTPTNFDNDPKDKLRPVMFWIHGGGLLIGTAASTVYNSSILAGAEDIVVVTINYRLGRAAWFVDPELEGSPTGNGAATGFLDMITALKWVQHNIESFGGDPDQVTIAGESGGGWAVCGLVVSPLARGLFRRSIQMSGSCIKSIGRFRGENEAKAQTKQYANYLDVTSVEDMRSMDMQTIADAGFMDPTATNLPGVDGYVFPMDPLELMESGHINGDSVMIGTLFRESFTAEPWNTGWVPEDIADLSTFYGKHFHDSHVKLLEEAYPVDDVAGKIWKYPSLFDDGRPAVLVSTQLQTDCSFRCGSLAQTELITEHPITRDVPVYFYQYGWIEEPWDRVSHGQDIMQLFGQDMKQSPMWNNYTVFSEEFVKITQNFFGAYIRGEGVLDDASIQNGKYIQIVDEVKSVDLSDLDVVKERCEAMFELDNDAFGSNSFCLGSLDTMAEDMLDSMMQGATLEEDSTEGHDEGTAAGCDAESEQCTA